MGSFYNHAEKVPATRTLSVTSGKGGVGKTTLTVNLAFTLAEMGKKVLILDGDIGLANIDIFLGIRPNKTLEDFFAGEERLNDIIVKVNKNIHVIPSASGLTDLKSIDVYKRKMLMDEVGMLETTYDYLIVDTASGIDENVQYLNSSVQDVLVVITPEPASMADAYALIKLLHNNHKVNRFSVVANKVLSEKEAKDIYQRINRVSDRFLNVHLSYLGYVPLDPKLRQSSDQKLICKARPSAASSIALKRIAESIGSGAEVGEVKGNLQFFWNQLLSVA
ncbi:MAG: MinD/ParA family protein [Bdellovibrionales bacterium]|nr:MinD/ParA family protein [Bdellovibrionales bacterium]